MPNGNPVEVEYARLVARLNEILRGINLASIDAIEDTSKRGTLASENARMWLEAEVIGKRLMELGGLQLMHRAAREVRRRSASMCDGLEGSWETRIPGYSKIRWLP